MIRPLVFAILALSVVALALSAGRTWLTPFPLASALYAGPEHDLLVWTLRMPRVLCGVLVGAGLGVSGAVFQSLLRNPLASPDIIGITQGAAFGAVASLAMGLSAMPGAWIGGLVAMATIFLLSATKAAGIDPMRLVLNGVGVGITAIAGTNILITQVSDLSAAQAMAWMAGSLNNLSWQDVSLAFGISVPLMIVLIGWQRRLTVMELGDDLARSLGVQLQRWRPILALCAAFLAAGLVATTGPLAFVALSAGPIARAIGRGGPNLVGAAMLGAALVTLADVFARVLAPSVLLPAGLYTSLFGAPLLIWILFRQFQAANA